MKTIKLRDLSSLVLLLLSTAFTRAVLKAATPPSNNMFRLRSYGGKCLDFGAPPQVAGTPVFIYGCNGTVAQQVRVQEINDRHEVILHAGDKIIGVKGIGTDVKAGHASTVTWAALQPEPPLELQDEPNRLLGHSPGQVFTLDGDSIILALNRNLVIKMQNNRGKNRTPLVLGARDLADAEFWTFPAIDGSAPRPTSGFVRVPPDCGTPQECGAQFAGVVSKATWGTVIEVDPGASIDLKDQPILSIAAGVTIRGDRRGTSIGPELWTLYPSPPHNAMLEITGENVRITGLRLRGPSRGRSHTLQLAEGIYTNSAYNTIIDHNDMSD